MPKQPAYKSLELYHLSKKLVVACYELTHQIPPEEKTNFSRYIRTAALCFHINIAQGAFQRPKKKKKFTRQAMNALVIIDAATEMLVEVGFATQDEADVVTTLSAACAQLLESWF